MRSTPHGHVAPRTGAWIETIGRRDYQPDSSRPSYRGVDRNDATRAAAWQSPERSPLVQGRGSKQSQLEGTGIMVMRSPLVQGRGSKPCGRVWRQGMRLARGRPSYRGVDRNRPPRQQGWDEICRPSYRGVDRNIQTAGGLAHCGAAGSPLVQGRGSKRLPGPPEQSSERSPLVQGRGSKQIRVTPLAVRSPLVQGRGSKRYRVSRGPLDGWRSPLVQGRGSKHHYARSCLTARTVIRSRPSYRGVDRNDS